MSLNIFFQLLRWISIPLLNKPVGKLNTIIPISKSQPLCLKFHNLELSPVAK